MNAFGSFPSKNSLRSYLILGILVDPPTKTTSSISDFFFWASSKALLTGSKVALNKSLLSSSNLALVKVSTKSTPSTRSGISIEYSRLVDKTLFAFSISFLSF